MAAKLTNVITKRLSTFNFYIFLDKNVNKSIDDNLERGLPIKLRGMFIAYNKSAKW
jgi:hypothetical protein